MDEQLEKDIIKLINKVRQEATYSRMYESTMAADAMEDVVNALERVLVHHSVTLSSPVGTYRGGWRTTPYRMFGVYHTCGW